MENLEKSILELISGENQERAKELINKLNAEIQDLKTRLELKE